jgi:hypothetical protein
MSVSYSACFASVMIAAAIEFAGSSLLAQPASQSSSPSQTTENTPVSTSNPILKASLDRLSAGSQAWRDALDVVRPTGRQVLIVTADQVMVADEAGGAAKPFDETVLAEVQPIADASQRVRVVIVAVNLPRLGKMQGLTATVSDFESDVDRILAHEVYGHALPYLLAGNLSGKCADPLPGQRASESCAIRRENEVRVQLGLGRRTEYGLHGLAMARRFRY